jgi:hypothetical protein
LKPLRKNFINLPKLFLDMIFMKINLDGLTCIQKFEVPYKWQTKLKNGNPKGVKFKNESNINYVSTIELL